MAELQSSKLDRVARCRAKHLQQRLEYLWEVGRGRDGARCVCVVVECVCVCLMVKEGRCV